jgi:hypothetical protein
MIQGAGSLFWRVGLRESIGIGMFEAVVECGSGCGGGKERPRRLLRLAGGTEVRLLFVEGCTLELELECCGTRSSLQVVTSLARWGHPHSMYTMIKDT